VVPSSCGKRVKGCGGGDGVPEAAVGRKGGRALGRGAEREEVKEAESQPPALSSPLRCLPVWQILLKLQKGPHSSSPFTERGKNSTPHGDGDTERRQ